MRRYLSTMFLVFLVVTGPVMRAADEPGFVKSPAVIKANGIWTICFSVKSPYDVAVAIVDGKGKVIRHLVAGVLGKTSPAPLKTDSLEQAVPWDGNDDLGKPAQGGPFQAQVSLGLSPEFDRMIGDNPAKICSVRALAVSSTGEVYAFFCFGTIHPNDNSMVCSVFSREGKYLRTIMPYPADIPEAKLKGIRRIEQDGGRKIPFIYQPETRSFIPGAGELDNHDAIVTSDGRVAFVGRMEYARYAQPGPLHLVVLNADGSVPDDGPVMTRIFPSGISATLALSPDEKTLYASDVRTSGGHYGKPVNVIYKFGWNDKEAKPFLGGSDVAGDLALLDPKGICTDAEGILYVADKGHDRIALFKPDGTFVGALKTTKPERVAVHRKTGALYVLGGPKINEVLKFNNWKDPAPVAKAMIPTFNHEGLRVSMALDQRAEQPVLWFGSHMSPYANYNLLRIEDVNGTFSKPVDIPSLPANSAQPSANGIRELSLDREHEVLYMGHSVSFDGRTGKILRNRTILPSSIYPSAAILSVGLDGILYVNHGDKAGCGISRFDPADKRLPFGESGPLTITNPGILRLQARGITADQHGNVYLLWQKMGSTDLQHNALAVYGPDGKLKQERLIDADIRSLNSVRVDYQGNIYLALGLRPGKDALPDGLKGRLPDGPKDPEAVCGVNFYPYIYGSIAKFGPEGGLINKDAGGVPCSYAQGAMTSVKGALWITPGASCIPSWRSPAPDICLCESPRFDVDGYGRSFYPDAARFRVGVLDTAGNEICSFGDYGNSDSAGPGSNVPSPAIPFTWVQAVAVGDEAAYVGDRLSRRIVRVKLSYKTHVCVPIP